MHRNIAVKPLENTSPPTPNFTSLFCLSHQVVCPGWRSPADVFLRDTLFALSAHALRLILGNAVPPLPEPFARKEWVVGNLSTSQKVTYISRCACKEPTCLRLSQPGVQSCEGRWKLDLLYIIYWHYLIMFIHLCRRNYCLENSVRSFHLNSKAKPLCLVLRQ